MNRGEAEDFLYSEAALLDQRRWAEWVALFTEDCLYWVPAWRNEAEPTTDPQRELSLIWYKGRRNLQDRVTRATQGQSVASTPLPRTLHCVINVRITGSSGDRVRIESGWSCDVEDVRATRTSRFFGHCRHVIVRSDEGWRISEKVVTLLNDRVPTVLDFYML